MAEWGLVSTEYTQDEIEHLALAYVRRKRFEAQLIAAEIGALWGGGGKRRESMTAEEAWALLEGK